MTGADEHGGLVVAVDDRASLVADHHPLGHMIEGGDEPDVLAEQHAVADAPGSVVAASGSIRAKASASRRTKAWRTTARRITIARNWEN